MIDWPLAKRLATLVAGHTDAPALRADLQALTDDSARHVIEYTGLTPVRPLPAAEAVGRGEWIAANVDTMRLLLDPALQRVGGSFGKARSAVRLGAAVVMTGEIGVILGLLAQRVLGQYELVLLDTTPSDKPPRLLYVMPNLAGAVRSFGADAHEFLMWVALHEVTHAVQFSGVPWLQSHLAGMVRELLDSAELRLDGGRSLRLPRGGDVRRLGTAVRKGDFLTLVASERERTTLDRMQATMAVIEGHAEHVMDAVGTPLLPTLPQLRAALDARRRSQSAPAKLLQRLLGMELKMRQYEQGKRFCDAVVRAGGIETLNRVWSSPAALPSLEELDDPLGWIERTDVPPLLSA